jgi:hypothetical protein
MSASPQDAPIAPVTLGRLVAGENLEFSEDVQVQTEPEGEARRTAWVDLFQVDIHGADFDRKEEHSQENVTNLAHVAFTALNEVIRRLRLLTRSPVLVSQEQQTRWTLE